MKLLSVYSTPFSYEILWKLMQEREPHQNISHKEIPSWPQHVEFVDSKPYLAWYLAIEPDGVPVGAVYITHRREIGVGILREWRDQGLARFAVEELMWLHPGRFLANIAPTNDASLAFFRKLGFRGPIQVTLEKPA